MRELKPSFKFFSFFHFFIFNFLSYLCKLELLYSF